MSSDRPARRIRSGHAMLTAHGEPWVWLTAASLAIAIAMIVGLLAFIAVRGLATFWPVPMERFTLADGRALLGEVTEREAAVTATQQAVGHPARRLVRTGDFDGTGNHYEWIDDTAITAIAQPEWATVVERAEAGRLHGVPKRLLHGEEVVAEGPEGVWAAYRQDHPNARSLSLIHI